MVTFPKSLVEEASTLILSQSLIRLQWVNEWSVFLVLKWRGRIIRSRAHRVLKYNRDSLVSVITYNLGLTWYNSPEKTKTKDNHCVHLLLC